MTHVVTFGPNGLALQFLDLDAGTLAALGGEVLAVATATLGAARRSLEAGAMDETPGRLMKAGELLSNLALALHEEAERCRADAADSRGTVKAA